MRITKLDLENRVERLNEITGQPSEPYLREEGKLVRNNGRLVSNDGNYHLDWAYGGVQLVQMVEGGGCRNVLQTGFCSKKECFMAIGHFIDGVEAVEFNQITI